MLSTEAVAFDDVRLDDYRHIDDAAFYRDRGVFVAEGRIVVRRAVAAGYRLRSALLSPPALRALERTLGATTSAPIYVCQAADFRQITGYDLHRGCLALVERPAPRAAAALAAASRLVVILEGLANPDNVGGIFRNAAAFGAGAVLLSPTTVDPLYRKAIRTSMAATLQVPFARADPWPASLAELSRAGFTIAALTPRADAEPLQRFSTRSQDQRVALLLGSEGEGLSASALAAADARVRIDTHPGVDSLNVAVAAGIALYELARN